MHICNRVDGTFHACCHAHGVITKEDGTPYSIVKGDTFEDAFRSGYMESLRQNIKNGVRDRRCKLCWKLEDRGVPSKRQHDGERYAKLAHERIRTPGALPFKPISWDIKLGSHCNLKCRMCNPMTSVTFMAEAIQNNWINREEGKTYSATTKDFMQYPAFREELLKLVRYTEEIYFLGGEPTLMDSHLEIVDAAIAMDRAKYITLRWSTNLYHFDSRFIERAKKFRMVIIDCSIDGFGHVNEYIRYPMEWSKIESRLTEIQKELPDATIKVVTTVQAYNVFELEMLLEWGEQRNLEITFNYLEFPEILSAQNLPARVRELLEAKYQKLNHPTLNEFLSWFKGAQGDSLKFDQFLKYTQSLDSVRRQSFKDLVPQEFREALQLNPPTIEGYIPDFDFSAV